MGQHKQPQKGTFTLSCAASGRDLDLRNRSFIKVWKKCIKQGDLGSSESVALGSALCTGAVQLALQVWLCRALVLTPAPPGWNFCRLQTGSWQGVFSSCRSSKPVLGAWACVDLQSRLRGEEPGFSTHTHTHTGSESCPAFRSGEQGHCSSLTGNYAFQRKCGGFWDARVLPAGRRKTRM